MSNLDESVATDRCKFRGDGAVVVVVVEAIELEIAATVLVVVAVVAAVAFVAANGLDVVVAEVGVDVAAVELPPVAAV